MISAAPALPPAAAEHTATVTPLYSAADVQHLIGDQLFDRWGHWRTVLSITDARRAGRVWVLYTDGTCPVEDVTYLLRFEEG